MTLFDQVVADPFFGSCLEAVWELPGFVSELWSKKRCQNTLKYCEILRQIVKYCYILAHLEVQPSSG